jgi:hypothetical protein
LGGKLGLFRKKKLPSELELDAPPEPPKSWMEEPSSSEPIDQEMMLPNRNLPQQPKLEDIPPLPEEPVMPQMEDDFNTPLPEVKPKKGWFKKKELPEIPPLPSEEPAQEFPTIPKEEVEEPVAETKEQPEVPQKQPVREKYVSMEQFRTIQENISDAKHVIRSIDEFLVKFSEDKEAESREHSLLRDSLANIHEKIIFIDKTLFEESSREV